MFRSLRSFVFVAIVVSSILGVTMAPAGAIAATPPGAPTTVTGVAGHFHVVVSWKAPTSNGGSPITAYTVTSSPGSKTCVTATTSCTVTGLTAGTSYTFTVKATNAKGTGTSSVASAAVKLLGLTAPDAPTHVVGVPETREVEVVWKAPTSDGGSPITGYTVTSSPGSFTCSSTVTFCSVTGLTPGTGYTFTVTATNAIGTSVASAVSSAVVPLSPTVPGAPTISSVTPSFDELIVSIGAPNSDGGEPITGYTVTASPGGATCTTSSDVCLVSGLIGGQTYTLTVTATNAVGTGPQSTPSNGVQPLASSVPGAPTILRVLPNGPGSLVVMITAPASSGGAPIMKYVVTASPGGATCTSPGGACMFKGLTSGTSYSFTVVAINRNGTSSASAGSTPVKAP